MYIDAVRRNVDEGDAPRSPLRKVVLLFSQSNALGSAQLFRLVALSSMVALLLAYLYRWTSSSFSHDALWIYQMTPGTIDMLVDNGRYLTPLIFGIRGAVTPPFLIGVVGSAFLILSNFVIIRTLHIENRLLIVACCAVLSVNACVTLINATYIKDFDCYMLALLFSSCSVLFLEKRPSFAAISVVFLTMSMALYQSYVQTAAVLVLLCTIRFLVRKTSLREVLKYVAKAVVVLIASCCLYFFLRSVLIGILETSAGNTYNSVSSFGNGLLDNVATRLLETYYLPFRYLLSPETSAPRFVGVLNVILCLVFVAVIVIMARMQKFSPGRALFVSAAILLIPLAGNIFYFAANGMQTGLMIYAFSLLGPGAAMGLSCMMEDSTCAESNDGIASGRQNPSAPKPRKTQRRSADYMPKVVAVLAISVVAACLLSFFCSFVYANQCTLKKNLEYQSTLSLTTRIASEMENTDGYHAGETTVLVKGLLYENPLLADVRQGLPKKRDGRGSIMYGTGLSGDVSLTGFYTYKIFFTNVLGYPVNFVDYSLYPQADRISEDVDAMPVFPDKGYCRMIDDIMVLKLS